MRWLKHVSDPANAFAGAALVLPPLAVLSPLGIAPLAGVAVLFAIVMCSLGRQRWPIPDRRLLLIVAAFVGWTAATALWSLDPGRSIATAIRVGIICLGGLILVEAVFAFTMAQRDRVARGLAYGAVLGGALLAINFVTDVGINRLFADDMARDPITLLNRTGSVVAIVCWPIALIACRRWRWIGYPGVLVLAVLALTRFEPQVPLVAFGAATIACVIALWRTRPVVYALAGGLIVFLMALPSLPQIAPWLDAELTEESANDNSVSHRLGIWSFSTGRALEKPLGGWGMGTSRAIPGGRENLLILGEPNADAPAIPLHPHNAAVQIWLEAGLPALLIAAFLVLRSLRRIPRVAAGRIEAATLLATSTALLVIAHLSYGIWQGWWFCFIWLAIALTLALTTRPASD